VWGALQVVGDKWTLLVVRELARGARRTTELLAGLQPISSRTLMDRLRDLERDALLERRDFGGSPPHVEYVLTERGRRLTPLLDALRAAGEALDCNACDDRRERHGDYCDACPRAATADDSIVLL
jgi:DNA-binding HxlR family transcriptional regulator